MAGKELSQSGTVYVLEQLVEGTAWFEFVETPESDFFDAPFASLSAAFGGGRNKKTVFPCFARTGWSQALAWQRTIPALKKTKDFRVQKVAADGPSMFRALALGIAANKGISLNTREEVEEADKLRREVMHAICSSEKGPKFFEEVVIAITVEESLKGYCERIKERIPSSQFLGGKSELLVLTWATNGNAGLVYAASPKLYHCLKLTSKPHVQLALPSVTSNEQAWEKILTSFSSALCLALAAVIFLICCRRRCRALSMLCCHSRQLLFTSLPKGHTLEIVMQAISEICNQHVIVYEAKEVRGGCKYMITHEYPSVSKNAGQGKEAQNSKPVRLLYSGNSHYDLLLDRNLE